MDNITDHKILSAMKSQGGGFVSRLADAGFHADSQNLERLKLAFHGLWDQYREVVRQELERETSAGKDLFP